MRIATCTRCLVDAEVLHDHAHRAICASCARAEGVWTWPLDCDDDTAADHAMDGPS